MLLEKENVNEVQIHWRKEFGMPPLPSITVAQLCDKFGADGTGQNVGKEWPEDLEVQLTMEVLRQCYRSSYYLHEVCMAKFS
jgi:hypothetical protein